MRVKSQQAVNPAGVGAMKELGYYMLFLAIIVAALAAAAFALENAPGAR